MEFVTRQEICPGVYCQPYAWQSSERADLVQVERGREGTSIVYSHVCDGAIEVLRWEELGFDGCVIHPDSIDAVIALARCCLT